MFGGERHFFLAVGCGERRRWMTFVPSLTSGDYYFWKMGYIFFPSSLSSVPSMQYTHTNKQRTRINQEQSYICAKKTNSILCVERVSTCEYVSTLFSTATHHPIQRSPFTVRRRQINKYTIRKALHEVVSSKQYSAARPLPPPSPTRVHSNAHR